MEIGADFNSCDVKGYRGEVEVIGEIWCLEQESRRTDGGGLKRMRIAAGKTFHPSIIRTCFIPFEVTGLLQLTQLLSKGRVQVSSHLQDHTITGGDLYRFVKQRNGDGKMCSSLR